MSGFFADECVHADLISALRKAGFEVLTVKTAGLVGADDEQVSGCP